MVKYIFSNILGSFIFDDGLKIIDKAQSKEELIRKYKALKEPDADKIGKILAVFKDKKYFNEFYFRNLSLTKRKVKESVNEDILVIQAINSIGEANKAINLLTKRLREWYALYNPEFSYSVNDNEKFVELILSKNDKKIKETMGADFKKENLEPITDLVKEISNLHQLRHKQEAYLRNLMEKQYSNLTAIAGYLIGAKLIEHAGSLKHLSELPASVVQMLGAERALFRHMKTGSRPPKYGVLHEHPLISQAKKSEHGKIARALADKIAIAVKVDYFKGKFIGNELRKKLEDKFKK